MTAVHYHVRTIHVLINYWILKTLYFYIM